MVASLSLAQVEEELRAAEAYLTGGSVLTATPTHSDAKEGSSAGGDAHEREMQMTEVRGLLGKPRIRPVLSEERRKEILAKLSSERQAAMRARGMGQDGAGGGSGNPNQYTASVEYVVPDPQLSGEKLSSMIPAASDDPSEGSTGRRSSIVSDQTSEGSVELFYASDVLGGTPTRARVSSLSYAPDEGTQLHDFTENGRSPHEKLPLSADDVDFRYDAAQSAQPNSTMAKLFQRTHSDYAVDLNQQSKFAPSSSARAQEVRDAAACDAATGQEGRKVTWGPTVAFTSTQSYRDPSSASDSEAFDVSLEPPKSQLRTRLDILAQPRVDLFVEREKKRLQQETESLRECTFKPNLAKQQAGDTRKASHGSAKLIGNDPRHCSEHSRSKRPNTERCPWLSLSPRQSEPRGDSRLRTARDGDQKHQSKGESVVQRLHLDGTMRYDLREQAKEALEAERLRSCTFTPAINPTSRSLAFAVSYRPIHERVSDIQRAKNERTQVVLDRLATEGGAPSFTPKINSKSREIAETILTAKDASGTRTDCGKIRSVTDRLVEDAGNLLERRSAIQDYYDELTRQPFAPKISEASEEIVKHRPEFQHFDFVMRQDYFQSREQEKREALEDVCEDSQSAPFKPDIGNAEEVLKQLRPDLANESPEEKLYRLIYRDPKNLEVKKQKLREEEYAKCTFKPDINPVSKALGRPSTIDQLARPVAGVSDSDGTPLDCRDGRPCPDTSSREALKKYFAGKRFRSKIALEMEQAERAECTFQPTLISSYKTRGMCSSASTSKLGSQARSGQRSVWRSDNLLHFIETRRQRKEEQMEAKRNALALKELEECTFQPNVRKPRERNGESQQEDGTKQSRKKRISSSSPSPPRDEGGPRDQKPVIVRGLGRFLELRELAKKQQIEQQEREQRAFRPNVSYEPRSCTVPKPFKLSESSKESIRRRLRAEEEKRDKEREECTFRPRTLESQKRKVLHHMFDR